MILYHYTSLDALYKIIDGISENEKELEKHTKIDIRQSKLKVLLNKENNTQKLQTLYNFSLRTTNVQYLNDPTEGEYFWKTFYSQLKKYEKSNGLSPKSNYITKYHKSLGRNIYILSLSKDRDKLLMWRGYGQNGKGVSIGINAAQIPAGNALAPSRLSKCEYLDKKKLLKTIQEKSYCKEIYESLKIKDNVTSVGINDFFDLCHLMSIYKHPSYSEEQEYRVIHTNTYPHKSIYHNGLIKPYQNIVLPVSAIKEITLGPCNDYHRNKVSIERMLEQKLTFRPVSIKIKKSEVPYIQ